jgi:predicted RNA binding protein YcfA (HicA-like mRNA interferase family)
VRQGKGDHEIWQSPISGKRFVVDGKIKSRHTANAIMKQAGIDHHF